MQLTECSDIVDLAEDRLEVDLGINNQHGEEDAPPLYISLLVDNLILHDCMLYSGASNNAMPLDVMKQRVLKVTRPYCCIYAMDS
jgi:hypothetical protein